jgi:hypothetical protein
MKKKMLLTFAMLALTVGQATAQRVLPKMQGIAIGGGMVDGKSDSFYGGMTVDTYTKGGNKWVFGAEYLQLSSITPSLYYRPADEVAAAIKGATLQWAKESEADEEETGGSGSGTGADSTPTPGDVLEG